MLIRALIWFSAIVHIGLAASVQSREHRHGMTLSECAEKGGECDETKGRPVCGTDDRTYPSRCHLHRVQCTGNQVSLKHRGPCKGCKEAREYALKHKARSPQNFIPTCKRDGTYAAVQCLGDTGCWCSDNTGKPIDNTTVRIGRPPCRQLNKSNTRRSPGRNITPTRTTRLCTQADRAEFNVNLLKIFENEYKRAKPAQDMPVISWKFSSLDVNANQLLDKKEFRELRQLVKRAVKPHRCGRTFGKFCDANGDKRLTRLEWNSCLAKDGNNRHSMGDYNVVHGYVHHNNAKFNINLNQNQQLPANNNNNNPQNNFDNNNINRHSLVMPNLKLSGSNIHHNLHQHNLINSNKNNNNNNNNNDNKNRNLHESSSEDLTSVSEADETEESVQDYGEDVEPGYDDEMTDDIIDDEDDEEASRLITQFPLNSFLRPKPDPPVKDADVDSDCFMDREAALEEQHHGGTILYVPECTSEGRYQRVQCYQSTPYCWCVNEESGKPIPGTSVKDKKPQCDTIITVMRPMKGCPEPRKTEFLKDLKLFLKSKIPASLATSNNTTNWNSDDERIATLSFVLLDKNKSKSWERKEWKIFRELVTASKNLRKCGKKMPRYCDVNSDKKITLTEWLNCLQPERVELSVVQKASQSVESVTSKPSKLIGSNPLEQYLKD